MTTAPDTTYTTEDWFRCPACSAPEDAEWLEVTFALGFGNVSLDLYCRWCGFSHKARDWRNQNLRTGLRLRRWFTQAFLTHPLLGSTPHDAAKCAACSARGHVHVELELVSETNGQKQTNAAVLRLHCDDCDESYESRLTHT